jgi:hypothetical protein
MNMQISKENRRLKQRVERLESALKAMLDVAWPNPDLPDSQTNRAIKRAQRVLRDAATRTKDVTPERTPDSRGDVFGLSGVSNPNPRHNRHRPDRRRRVKHHLFHFRPPAHVVPRIIAVPDPTAASPSLVKLEHVLPIVRVEEQPADASF